MDKITPLRRQYLDIKRQHPDAIVFFRLGDFYETFDEDAKITSRELDIVLTSRPVSKGVRVPMAGIPHHAAENYLSRLINKGYHVAICEQISDEPENGLVPREVIRVVTPGTVVEPGLLQQPSNNYLATVFFQDQRAGLAYVDISTGEFAVTELVGKDVEDQIRSELFRLQPSEILWPDSLPRPEHLPGFSTPYESWHYELGRCTDTLKEHFGVISLDGFGLRGKPMAVRVAGAILAYLEDTQRQSLKLLNHLSTYTLDEFMVLMQTPVEIWSSPTPSAQGKPTAPCWASAIVRSPRWVVACYTSVSANLCATPLKFNAAWTQLSIFIETVSSEPKPWRLWSPLTTLNA